MSEIFTDPEVRAYLREETEASGGVSPWARARGFSPQYVSGVIGGTRPLSPRILGELGLERVVHYITRKEPTNGQAPKVQGERRAPRA